MALEDRIDAARRLTSEGQTTVMTAAILRVHPTTVRGYLSAGHCPQCGRVKVHAESRRCRACRPRNGAWSDLSDGELIERVRAWTARFGAPPTKGQWRRVELGGHPSWQAEYPAWPSAGAVAQRYGTWGAALRAAGVTAITWTPAAMLYALRRFAGERGPSPTAREWPRNCEEHPSASMVSDAFGSWRRALGAAGVHPVGHGPWTKPQIGAALRRLADDLGRPPAAGDLDHGDGPTPGRITIRRHYGSLVNALGAAGLYAGVGHMTAASS